MASYDGFSTVNNPHDYINAPAMIMPEENLGSAFQPGPTPTSMIVQAAVNYAHNFTILSADELQSFYSERTSLKRQLTDIKERLTVELKMQEAAQSLSRLHAEEAGVLPSNRSTSSRITGSKRLSRLLGSPESSHVKHEKRLSRQAAEEVAISSEKINDLKDLQAEVQLRHSQVEITILQHHAGVLAKDVSGQTLPTHQRNRSNASSISLSAPISPPPSSGRASVIANGLSTPRSAVGNQRQSWMMGPSKHQRQLSASSSNVDTQSLHDIPRPYRPQQQNQQLLNPPPQSEQRKADTARYVEPEEIDSLVAKITQLQPRMVFNSTPTLKNQFAFISQSFESLVGDLNVSQNELERSSSRISSLQSELEETRSSMNTLAQQNKEIQLEASRQASRQASVQPSYSQQLEEKERELRHQIDMEHSTSVKWRSQAELQRQQLLETTKALEDVTKMAVEFEGERSRFQLLFNELDKKINTLESEKVGLLQQRLGSSSNTSLVCKEFQQIIADLVTKHQMEVRSLYPKFHRTYKAESENIESQGTEEPSKHPIVNDNLIKEPNKQNSELTAHVNEVDDKPKSDSPTTHKSNTDENSKEVHLNQISTPKSANTESFPSYGSQYNAPYSPSYSSQPATNVPSPRAPRKPVNTEDHQSLPRPLSTNSVNSEEFDSNESSVLEPPPRAVNHQKKSSQGTITESNYRTPTPTGTGPQDEPFLKHSSLEYDSHNAENSLAAPAGIADVNADESYDSSLQHTSESLMMPPLNRHDTDMSQYSKTSSFYPDNNSRTSFASRNASTFNTAATNENETNTDTQQKSGINAALPSKRRDQSFDFDDDDELL